MACVPSKDWDQPRHLPSLIKVLAVCMKKPLVLIYPLSTQWRLWSDWADAQTELSLRCAQTFCWFCHAASYLTVSLQPFLWQIIEKYCKHLKNLDTQNLAVIILKSEQQHGFITEKMQTERQRVQTLIRQYFRSSLVWVYTGGLQNLPVWKLRIILVTGFTTFS